MSDILLSLDAFSRAGLSWLLWMNLWTCIIVALAILADRLLARWISSGMRSVLYIAAFARLLLPVAWASPLAWIAAQPAIDLSSRVPPMVMDVDHGSAADALAGAAGWPGIADASELAAASAAPAGVMMTWPVMLLVCYILIAFCLLVAWCVRRHRLMRWLRAAQPATVSLDMTRSPVPILMHDSIGPAVVGILQPRIILPESLIRETSPAMLQMIIAHERAHIERYDHMLAPLLQLIVLVCWPILPLWYASRRIRRLMECACDERALRGADSTTRCDYGRLLLACADRFAAKRRTISMGLLGFNRDLTARVRAIATGRSATRTGYVQFCMIGIVSSILLAGTTTAMHHDAARNALPAEHSEESDVTYSVTVRIFDGVLSHPAARHLRDREAAGQAERLIDEDILEEVLQHAAHETALVSSPRMLLSAEQDGVIRIGKNADDPALAEGLTMSVRVHPGEHGLNVIASYVEVARGTELQRSTGERQVVMQSGQTLLLLASAQNRNQNVTSRCIAVTVEEVDEEKPLRPDMPARAPGPDRWNITITAYDVRIPIRSEDQLSMVCFNTDPFWPYKPKLEYQITLVPNVCTMLALTEPDSPNDFAAQFKEWVRANGTERMSQKVGTRTLLNRGAANWTFPHMAHGGSNVEQHVLSLKLGRDEEEYVSVHYRMPDRSDAEQFPSWHMRLFDSSRAGLTRLLVMPLANGEYRVIFMERTPYDHNAQVNPQTAS